MKRERILALDALRGFALLGILFGNLMWFTGYAVLGPGEKAALSTSTLDAAVTLAIRCVVDGKFYGVFSMLFGVGLGLLAQRAEREGRSPLVRRLLVLLVLGLGHALLLWFGDIVSLYAVCGLVVLPLLRSSPRRLLQLSGVAFALPVGLAGLWAWLGVASPPYGPYEQLSAFGAGSYAQVLEANFAFLLGRWEQALHSGRMFKLFGLFLLGLWSVRVGLVIPSGRTPRGRELHRSRLRRLALVGIGLGVPGNVALALGTEGVPGAMLEAVAVPGLAVGYSAVVLLLATTPVACVFALPGRMTLTHYLVQTVIGISMFYGCGAGLWGKLGAVWIVPIAVGIFLAQCGLSALWLRRFSQGPVEALWRWASGGRIFLDSRTLWPACGDSLSHDSH